MEVTVLDDTKSSDTSTATRPAAYIRDISSFVKDTLNKFDENLNANLAQWTNSA